MLDSEACPTLKTGFLGGYHYRRIQVSGERFDNRPNKNKFSHVHDALQYAVTGAGEGRALISGGRSFKSFVAKRSFNVFDRMGKKNRRQLG
jgi:hypothetical protein